MITKHSEGNTIFHNCTVYFCYLNNLKRTEANGNDILLYKLVILRNLSYLYIFV